MSYMKLDLVTDKQQEGAHRRNRCAYMVQQLLHVRMVRGGGGGICLTLKHLHRRSKAWEGKAKRANCSKSVKCMVDICLHYS